MKTTSHLRSSCLNISTALISILRTLLQKNVHFSVLCTLVASGGQRHELHQVSKSDTWVVHPNEDSAIISHVPMVNESSSGTVAKVCVFFFNTLLERTGAALEA